MKKNNLHIIHRVNLEIITDNEPKAFAIKADIDAFLEKEFFPIIETLFDESSSNEDIKRFDSIDLEIKMNPSAHLNEINEQLINQLQRKIKEAELEISEQINTVSQFEYLIAEEDNSELEKLPTNLKTTQFNKQNSFSIDRLSNMKNTFLHFLDSGQLPWYAKSSMIHEFVDSGSLKASLLDKTFIENLIIHFSSNKNSLERFIQQFDNDIIELFILQLLESRNIESKKLNLKIFNHHQPIKELLYKLIINSLIQPDFRINNDQYLELKLELQKKIKTKELVNKHFKQILEILSIANLNVNKQLVNPDLDISEIHLQPVNDYIILNKAIETVSQKYDSNETKLTLKDIQKTSNEIIEAFIFHLLKCRKIDKKNLDLKFLRQHQSVKELLYKLIINSLIYPDCQITTDLNLELFQELQKVIKPEESAQKYIDNIQQILSLVNPISSNLFLNKEPNSQTIIEFSLPESIIEVEKTSIILKKQKSEQELTQQSDIDIIESFIDQILNSRNIDKKHLNLEFFNQHQSVKELLYKLIINKLNYPDCQITTDQHLELFQELQKVIKPEESAQKYIDNIQQILSLVNPISSNLFINNDPNSQSIVEFSLPESIIEVEKTSIDLKKQKTEQELTQQSDIEIIESFIDQILNSRNIDRKFLNLKILNHQSVKELLYKLIIDSLIQPDFQIIYNQCLELCHEILKVTKPEKSGKKYIDQVLNILSAINPLIFRKFINYELNISKLRQQTVDDQILSNKPIKAEENKQIAKEPEFELKDEAINNQSEYVDRQFSSNKSLGVEKQKLDFAGSEFKQENEKNTKQQAEEINKSNETSEIKEVISSDTNKSLSEPEVNLKTVYVQNAGLILSHPFLVNLFNRTQCTDEKNNLFPDKKPLAIHILHYLATGKEQEMEYNLTFEKFLCGVPLDTPVNRKVILPDQIKMECNDLLQSMINYWSALKNTSPDWLRQMFFDREGKLIQRDNKYKIIIERKAQDVLLEKLNWTISIFKLPWINKLIQVEW